MEIYIYISLFAHTSYKVVHRKCNCIQTEYKKKIIILLKYMNKMNSDNGCSYSEDVYTTWRKAIRQVWK